MEAKAKVAKTPKIQYTQYLVGRKKNDKNDKSREYFKVTHDDLDKWTFEQFEHGMYESVKNEKLRHFYIDLDFKNDDKDIVETFIKCVDCLDDIAEIFGEYQICGYCTLAELYDVLSEKASGFYTDHIQFKEISDCDKALSCHVVFYETCIDGDELCEIMTTKTYDVKIKDLLGKAFDTSVYKHVGKEQLFRHPFAHKRTAAGTACPLNQKKGVNPENLGADNIKASQLVVTCKGGEQQINKDEWLKVFPLKQQAEQQYDDDDDDEDDDDITPERTEE